MMFAQVNSEHCRHKIFNADWTIDDEQQSKSLFAMIRNTYQQHPQAVQIAYKDNAAVLKGEQAALFHANPAEQHYAAMPQPVSIVLKVETHNHPTAISPFPGAATGSGGEIRDEAATGRGAKPVAGLCGFSVSDLHIPDYPQSWEWDIGKPEHMCASLDIMLQGPIGAASFNNEFGRPNICGYFRSYCMKQNDNLYRGYHKPIMIAGGIGAICQPQIEKQPCAPGSKIIVLGGPAMAIGLGGGAASSQASSEASAKLDFASVQRANPEMQRRAQEVINHCWALGKNNPILSIHDVGAGGLSNAIPEIVEADGRGVVIQLRDIPNAEPGMSPMEIWCNEAQERFVLAIAPKDIDRFISIAQRERCPFAVVGEATEQQTLKVIDTQLHNDSIDMPMAVLFEDMPQQKISAATSQQNFTALNIQTCELEDTLNRVLSCPTVANKSFLITIGDRSVGGLIARDQMVGPWQVPVSDVAVSLNDFTGNTGAAMAMGERAPVALIDAAASARLAVGEAITNLLACDIKSISDISLSANWMAAPQHSGEAVKLYQAVRAIGLELCPALKIAIPVGKDSLSMRCQWQQQNKTREVVSPLSLVITAAAPVADVRRTLTPQLQNQPNTHLYLIDLSSGQQRLGGSVLAQISQAVGAEAPDVDDSQLLLRFVAAMHALQQGALLLAYHDRSDGGLIATVCEMMFAGHVGVDLQLSCEALMPYLFNEELGTVLQINDADEANFHEILKQHDLLDHSTKIGTLNHHDTLSISNNSENVFEQKRTTLQRTWSETSYRMQALRDNPQSAQQEFDAILDTNDPGLQAKLTFDLKQNAAPMIASTKPKVAILREQGVNGHIEMAAAFYQAGFDCYDVHMTDLLRGRFTLDEFVGLAACGGFSFGDVLGAGRGWAQSILMCPQLRDMFAAFFDRHNTFTLGVCNGCQMLSHLSELIPGAEHWPVFTENLSQQFEARVCLVEVTPSSSILLQDMSGSVIPVVVSHAQGHATFSDASNLEHLQSQQQVALRFVDHHQKMTTKYPLNPNGSAQGVTGFCSKDGRVTIMMPHPERVFRSVQHSWHPKEWGDASPWSQLFTNALRILS